MNKEQKAEVVDEIAEQLGEAEAIFAVDYRGISVPEAAELRAKLREADAVFTVVKNRLAKRAAEKAGTAGLDEFFDGPIALTFVKGDAVVAAKAISTFSREHDVLEYRGGLMDGEPLDPEKFTAIARLPGLDVLHGQLVGVTASPLTGLTRGLASMLSGLAVGLGQIAEQGLVSGEAPAAEAEEPAAEEEPPGEEKPEEPEPEEKAEEPAAEEEQAQADPDAPGREAEEADGDDSQEELAAEESAEEEPPAEVQAEEEPPSDVKAEEEAAADTSNDNESEEAPEESEGDTSDSEGSEEAKEE